jgi:hypothetical protein
MAEIDVDFCFYDDPDVGGDPPDYANSRDADRYSIRLRESHCDLWSKELPDGTLLTLQPNDDGWLDVSSPRTLASIGFRLSSDTIATPHERYQGRGMHLLWGALPTADRNNYKRRFYTIGGFIVFPRRFGSINVSRGSWTGSVQDRFDLTLECIRRYYLGETDASVNPSAPCSSMIRTSSSSSATEPRASRPTRSSSIWVVWSEMARSAYLMASMEDRGTSRGRPFLQTQSPTAGIWTTF